ncbi:MAG: MFS transporter [Streptosporangiales bacterium]|nr:MFS transporter [Streptosporangiales bacterium]
MTTPASSVLLVSLHRTPCVRRAGVGNPMLEPMEEHRRDFRLLLVSALATASGYGLLLPVVPLWAQAGGAAPAGIGATNAAFLLATVVAQFGTPAVLRLLGHRETLALGSLLFGLPVFAYAPTSWLPALITVGVVRGIGFALVVVTGSALVAHLLPAHRRGRGLGQFGLAIGLPNVIWLPAGPWLTEQVSFPVVFAVGGALPLVGAAITLAMRIRTRTPRARRAPRTSNAVASVRPAELAAPFLVVLAGALASSAYVTFLPAAVDRTVAVTVGLLGYGVGIVVGRWLAGVFTDSHRRPVLLGPGVAVSGLGMLTLAAVTVTDSAALAVVAVAVGGLAFGGGYGAVQNTTLSAMFARVEPAGFDKASTVWNMAVDAGTGAGSMLLGLLAGAAGYPWTFAATAAMLAVTWPLAFAINRRERNRGAA